MPHDQQYPAVLYSSSACHTGTTAVLLAVVGLLLCSTRTAVTTPISIPGTSVDSTHRGKHTRCFARFALLFVFPPPKQRGMIPQTRYVRSVGNTHGVLHALRAFCSPPPQAERYDTTDQVCTLQYLYSWGCTIPGTIFQYHMSGNLRPTGYPCEYKNIPYISGQSGVPTGTTLL